MLEIEIYRALARYNRWMNERLLHACAQLSDAARNQASGAPFGSIHGVWNHILVADRIWLARFEQRPLPFSRLDTQVCADFEELRRQRAQTDDAIDAFVASLSSEKLAAPFSFVSISNPQQKTFPFWFVVTHFFNHQTHHCGQISALLEQAGGDCGVTDLLAMPELAMPKNGMV